MRAYCIDTSVLIIGVQKKSDDPDAPRRTNTLLDELEANDDLLLLPTVCLTEFLVGLDDKEAQRIQPALYERFQVVEFDFRAALHAAKFLRESLENDLDKELKDQGYVAARQFVKTDSMMVAIAAAHKAKVLTHDRRNNLQRIADAAGVEIVDVEENVPLREQPPLFQRGK